MVYNYEIRSTSDRGYYKSITADEIVIESVNPDVVKFVRDGRIVGFAPTTMLISEDEEV